MFLYLIQVASLLRYPVSVHDRLTLLVSCLTVIDIVKEACQKVLALRSFVSWEFLVRTAYPGFLETLASPGIA